MRQQHDQTGLSDPFGLAGGDELVDDALSGVGEVAELSLPQDKRVRVGHGVAQLETQDSVLAQRAVAHGVGCLKHI